MKLRFKGAVNVDVLVVSVLSAMLCENGCLLLCFRLLSCLLAMRKLIGVYSKTMARVAAVRVALPDMQGIALLSCILATELRSIECAFSE